MLLKFMLDSVNIAPKNMCKFFVTKEIIFIESEKGRVLASQEKRLLKFPKK